MSASWPTVGETETKWVMGDVPEAGDEYRPGARQDQGTVLSALFTPRPLAPCSDLEHERFGLNGPHGVPFILSKAERFLSWAFPGAGLRKSLQ